MKSIVLFGKGVSVLKCTPNIIKGYDDIAICNFPVLDDFFSTLISNRKIKYHFANCTTFDKRYDDKVNNQLQIEYIINTNYDKCNKYKYYIKNKNLIKKSIRTRYESIFKNTYNLNPSTGILALQYLIDTYEYNKILLVGFDNFKKGEQIYYFDINKINPDLNYLIKNNTITKKGNFNIISGHEPENTEKYLQCLSDKYKNIKIEKL